MRVLLVPVFNYPRNLNADSIWHITLDWAEALVSACPDAVVYRLVPKLDLPSSIKKFLIEGGQKKGHSRVHDIPVEMFTFLDMEEANLDLDVFLKFHPIFGDYPIDVVVCTSSVKLPAVYTALTCAGGEAKRPAFVAFDLLLRGLDTNEVSGVTDRELLLQATGQAISDEVFFESPKCKRMSLDIARRFLAPAQLKGLVNKGVLTYSGFNPEPVQPLPLDQKAAEFTVIVRGRMTSSKKVEEILWLYNTRVAAGHDLKIIVTTGDAGRIPADVQEEFKKNSRIDFRKLKDRADAAALMRSAHAFVLWSSHELFCVSLWEMFAAGLIGIIKDADWHRDMLPPNYPFVFKNAAEAYTMLAEIQENYEKWQTELAWVRDWVLEKYSYPRTLDYVKRRLHDLCEKVVPAPRDWAVEMLQKSGFDKFTLEQGFNYIAAHADMKDSAVKGRNPTRAWSSIGCREFVEIARKAGYVADLESATVRFIRSA